MGQVLGTPHSTRHLLSMRSLLFAALFAVFASPAFAVCISTAAGDVPSQIAGQTAVMLCQQNELKAAGDVQFAQLQLQAQLNQQQILLEEQLKFQQQMATLNTSLTSP
jgi:hypothetical protein